MADHKTLTDPELHEPKGIAALTGGASDADKAYLSDGAGSGSWQSLSQSEKATLSLGRAANNTTVTTIAVLGTYVAIGGLWQEESASVMTTTTATGTINVVTPGEYEVHADISMISNRSNAVATFSFMVNGVQTGPRIRRKIGTGADVGAVPIHSTLTGLLNGDAIQLCATFLVGEGGIAGDTITVENCVLIAKLEVAT